MLHTGSNYPVQRAMLLILIKEGTTEGAKFLEGGKKWVQM